jgi:site-specific recombinase XerD
MSQAIATSSLATGDILVNNQSFARHLRAGNLSDKTIYAYCGAVEQFAAYLGSKGMPQDVAAITREHVESFITHLLDTRKATTAHQRYRGLQSFFKWLAEEHEISETPMRNMKPPRLPEMAVPVLSETQLRALLRTCEGGHSFEERRDAALMRVFIDTGARLAEIAGLRWNPRDDENNDVDLEQGALRVYGKGRRWRLVPLGAKAIKSLDRYVRARAKHPLADRPWLWIGLKGQMTDSGIRQMLWRRGQHAGLGKVHPHQLRHSAAHAWLADGGAETTLMTLMGWRSRAMLSRYASSTAQERAMDAHKRHGLGDRL